MLQIIRASYLQMSARAINVRMHRDILYTKQQDTKLNERQRQVVAECRDASQFRRLSIYLLIAFEVFAENLSSIVVTIVRMHGRHPCKAVGYKEIALLATEAGMTELSHSRGSAPRICQNEMCT